MKNKYCAQVATRQSIRDRHAPPSRSVRTRESSPKDVDEEQQAVKEDECQSRPSSSTAIRRRDSVCRRDSEDSVTAVATEAKRMRLDDEAAPRLRLNASLATDPALRPAAVAALTVKPENTSPPNQTPPLPAGLQNGDYQFRSVFSLRHFNSGISKAEKFSIET